MFRGAGRRPLVESRLSGMVSIRPVDLDFGIYRIMNAKRDEISRFLDQGPAAAGARGLRELQGDASARLRCRPSWTRPCSKAQDSGRRSRQRCPRCRNLRAELAAGAGPRRAGRRGLLASLQLLPPLLPGRRLHLAAPLQGGRLRHPLRGRGGQAPLGQPRPVLHQDQPRTSATTPSSCRRADGSTSSWSTPSTEKDNNKAAAGKERRFILADDDPVC